MGHPVEGTHFGSVNFNLEINMFRRALVALCVLTVMAIPAADAQQPQELVRQLNRSGPRFGVTVLTGSLTDRLRSQHDIDIAPVITQFGWQFERQFASLESGPVALNEWVFLLGGMDQGTVLPSLTWLVGLRTPGNFEIGVGPNATPAGVAIAMSTGYTFKAGALAVPLNIAVVPGKYGVRASVLSGFNLYR